MKFANPAAGWVTEGMPITVLAAGKPVDEQCMLTYYGLTPKDRLYKSIQRPCKHTRVVLMRPSGVFVIVPITPLTVEVPQ